MEKTHAVSPKKILWFEITYCGRALWNKVGDHQYRTNVRLAREDEEPTCKICAREKKK